MSMQRPDASPNLVDAVLGMLLGIVCLASAHTMYGQAGQTTGGINQSGNGCQQKIVGGSYNTLNCAPPQRKLSSTQFKQIAESLEGVPSPGETFSAECPSQSAESCDYASQILAALDASKPGWNTKYRFGQALGNMRVQGGIAIHVSRSDVQNPPLGAKRLAEALNRAKIPVSITAYPIDPQEPNFDPIPHGNFELFVANPL